MATATRTDDRLSQLLQAVADPTRRRILKLLKAPRGCCSIGKPGGMCACDIEERVGLSQPTVSHHMAILRKAGLVTAEKHGPWTWYQRNEAALRELAGALTEAL